MNNNGLVIGITMVVVLIVGFFLGRFTADSGILAVQPAGSQSTTVSDGTDSSDAENASASGGTNIDTGSLPEGQRALLENLGIDADSVTITDEMVACAETKLGAGRVAEIQGGATPSFSEGAKLAACYSSG